MNTHMDEERDSQLAAMFDDELAPAECELLARRLARDPALRRQWGRYAVMSAALRGEHGKLLHSRLASRVAVAISLEPAFGANLAGARRTQRWLRPAVGAGVAASVALGAIMLLRYQSGVAPGSITASGVNPAVATATARLAAPSVALADRAREPESYVVPAAPGTGAHAMPAAQLANYVVAHSEFSTPLGRRNLLSALVVNEAPGSEQAAPQPAQDGQGSATEAQRVGNATSAR
jgi:sigma-E factor negative regulatory protein RseA